MRVYLSSTFSAHDDGREDLNELRQDLKRRGQSLGVQVELAEEDESVRSAQARGDVPGILEGCARRMSACDAFFGMLFERHGTRITLREEEVSATVSIFEAELLHASMTGKPIIVAQAREIVPGPELAAFLHIVERALGSAVVEVDRRSLPSLFEDFCRGVLGGVVARRSWLFDVVSIARVRRSAALETREPLRRFGSGMLAGEGAGGGSAPVILEALGRVEAGMASSGEALGQLERLSYLWMALRELALVPSAERLRTFAAETDRALGLWNSSAAWYGIHGAHPLGCLAALNELGAVRVATGQGDPPLGPRASAYYSVGAQLRSRPAARRMFLQSLRLSRAVMALKPADPSGAMQMIASAEARLALLGSPWRYISALDTFRRSYEWRLRNEASDGAVGEALNAYAFALGRLPWRRDDALRMASEGSALLRDASGDQQGHYLRAEHKRAELLRRCGRRDEALAVALAARDRAVTEQAADQARQFDALLDRWRTAQ